MNNNYFGHMFERKITNLCLLFTNLQYSEKKKFWNYDGIRTHDLATAWRTLHPLTYKDSQDSGIICYALTDQHNNE